MNRLVVFLALMVGAASLGAAERRVLHGHVPKAVARLQPVAALPGAQPLELALTLPLRNREALTHLLEQLYDPASPVYQQYLTPEQFAEQFGPTERDYEKVAGNGALSGTPLSSDVGVNSFLLSVTDPGGLSGSATMNLTVTPAPPILATVTRQGAELWLDWSGGLAPYQVQTATSVSNPDWQPLGGPTSATHLTPLPTDAAAFYRIVGQ